MLMHLTFILAWTWAILESPLAHDPMIGLEVIKTLQIFLNLRQNAVRRPTPR